MVMRRGGKVGGMADLPAFEARELEVYGEAALHLQRYLLHRGVGHLREAPGA
jgi:hypothetical protein